MAGIIIEITEPSQPGIRRRRFETFPVRVGRSYQNDLILSDPCISPDHLSVSETEGGYLIQDLDSTNGTAVAGRRMPENPFPTSSGDLITLGSTTLRILSPSHPVSPTQKLSFWTTLEQRKSFYLFTWFSLLPAFGIEMLNGFLSSHNKIRALDLIKENLGGVLFAIIWAALWMAVGYSITRRTRFHAQLLLALLFTMSMTVGDFLSDYLAYALNSPALQTGGAFLISGLLFALLLFYTLGIATRIRRNSRIVSALVTSTIVMLMGALVHFAAIPEFSPTPRVFGILRPPPVPWVGSRSIDAFLADSEEAIEKSREQVEK